MLPDYRYLSDKPCIEVPGRRGFMSRSAFEQVGGVAAGAIQLWP